MSSDRWFIGRAGKQLGPYRFEAIRQLAEHGKLRPDDLVWTEGMPEWKRADLVDGLLATPHVDSADLNPETPAAPAGTKLDSSPVEVGRPDVVSTRAGYLRRHWRGELSLRTSYWVNGFVVSMLLTVAIAVATESRFAEPFGALGTGLWTFGVLLTVIGVGIWQSVGVWKSAEQHTSRGGTPGWATTAKVMVVIGILRLASFSAQEMPALTQAVKLVFRGDSIPPSQLRVVNNASEVELSGGMSFGTADALKTILDATPTIRVVQLNNSGGWVSEGARVGELIQQRNLATFTARQCVSACLLAFIGGKERYLGSKGQLGFHEVSIEGVGGEVAKTGNTQFREAFLSKGVPAEFMDRALGTPNAGMWYPTTAELLNAHVVTAVADERDFASTGVAGWKNRPQLERDFADVPLFSALRRAEPTTYEKLKESYVSGIQAGKPERELTANLHAVIAGQVVPKYLAIGPDGPLVAYWRSQIAELRELRDIDPRHCVAALFPDIPYGDAMTRFSRVSEQTRQSDLRNLANLLDAATIKPAFRPAESVVQGSIRAAALRTEQRMPGAIAVASDPKRAAANPLKLCDAVLMFYANILELPPDQAGPLLRFLASSGS